MTADQTPLSVAQARDLDRVAVEELGMPSLLLMENAARGVAQEADALGDRFVILCGKGNNGGDGLAAARHLGPERCRIHLLGEPDPERSPDAALQLRILRAAGWEVPASKDVPADDPGAVWIDALFGTGLERAVEGAAAEWIAAMNAAVGPKLAVDLPSGLHGDRGEPLGAACVRADVTTTFAAMKQGLAMAGAREYCGRVVVVPLGIPQRRHPAS